jgi:hypothetical protein
MFKSVILAIAGTVLFALAIAGLVNAHSWYDPHCCSGSDCRPVAYDDVIEIEGGWKHLPTGVMFRRDQVLPSKDNKFHVCIGNKPHDMGRPYCIYVLNGS